MVDPRHLPRAEWARRMSCMCWRAVRNGLVGLVAVASLAGAAMADASAPFDRLAESLMDDLRETHDGIGGGLFGTASDRAPTLALYPFPTDRLPVAAATARQWVQRTLDALHRQPAAADVDIVSRDDLKAVINDIDRMTFDTDMNKVIQDLAAKARADILVVGRIAIDGRNVMLSYRAIDTGQARVLAATPAVRVAEVSAAAADGAVHRDAAIEAAVAHIRDRLPNLRHLRVTPFTFSDTGRTSEFGVYLTRRLTTALASAYHDPITGGALRLDHERGFRGFHRGIAPRAKTAQPAPRLSGTFWVLETTVDLHLTVQVPKADGTRWQGRVLRSSLPNLSLRPSQPAAETESRVNRHGLHVTSGRGVNPVYSIGETMALAVRTLAPARVFCIYEDSGGNVTKLLPNAVTRNRADDGTNAFRLGGADSSIAIDVTPPTGTETFRCYSVDLDLEARVPQPISVPGIESLEFLDSAGIDRIFRAIGPAGVSQAALTIRIRD